MSRRAIALPTVVALALGLCSSAGAASRHRGAPSVTPSPGTFSISPANHEIIGRPGLTLAPTTVSNTTGLSLGVRVIPVILHQSRTGAFTYGSSRAARRVLAVSTRSFPLASGHRQLVQERWLPGAGNRPAYVGVLFRTAAPGSRGVHTVEQILGLDLLGVPGAGPAIGRLTGVSAGDASAHQLRFTVSVRNVGHSYGTPSLVGLVVRTPHGRAVGRLTMTPGVILPRVTRDFIAELPSRLAQGRYVADATLRFNNRTSTRRLRFRVGPNGLLPATSLVPGAVQAHGSAGGPAVVTVPLHNAGTLTGGPRGSVTLFALHGGVAAHRPVARAALRGPGIAPGATRTARIELGHLRPGAYEAVVNYSSPVVATQPALVDLDTHTASAASVSHPGWLGGHLALVGLAAALAATLGVSGVRLRRLRQRVDSMRPTP